MSIELPAKLRRTHNFLELTSDELFSLKCAVDHAYVLGQRSFGSSVYDEDAGVYVRQGDADLATMVTGSAMIFFADMMRRALKMRGVLVGRSSPSQSITYLLDTGAQYDLASIPDPNDYKDHDWDADPDPVDQSRFYFIADNLFMRQIYHLLSIGYDSISDMNLEAVVRKEAADRFEEDSMSGVGRRVTDEQVSEQMSLINKARKAAYKSIEKKLVGVA